MQMCRLICTFVLIWHNTAPYIPKMILYMYVHVYKLNLCRKRKIFCRPIYVRIKLFEHLLLSQKMKLSLISYDT